MKVLILGDGLLGSEMYSQTKWDIASRKLGNLPKLGEWEKICSLINKYDVVVNCIAYTNSYSGDKKNHYDVNYRFAANLSEACNAEGIKLVHISTEFVYANNPIPPTEEDIPLPDNTWYAYTKLLADEYIKLNNPNYLICRELHKPNPFPYPKVWDVLTCGDTVDKISSIIIQLIKKDAKGLFNVGTTPKSLPEIASNSEIVPPPLNTPKDTRMNLHKLKNFLKNAAVENKK